MHLGDLTFGHYGRKITLSHGDTVVSGILERIDPVLVYDHTLCEDPNKAEGHITGYDVTIGGWSCSRISLDHFVVLWE